MGLILLEALGAAIVLVLIVWWTMFAGRKGGEPETLPMQRQATTTRRTPPKTEARRRYMETPARAATAPLTDNRRPALNPEDSIHEETDSSSPAAAALLLSGCAGGMTQTQKSTGIGAGAGALAGAAIGSLTGGNRGAIGCRRSHRRAGRRWRRLPVVAAHGEPEEADGSSHPGHRRGRDADRQQRAQARDPERRLLRRRPLGHQAQLPRRSSTSSPAACATTRTPRCASSATPTAPARDAINNPLSVDRAASTRDYLIARGVPSNAFRIEGRGSREPIADNNSDAGRAQNRRVEIFVGERRRRADRRQRVAPQAGWPAPPPT